jgi:hypothetical protein
MISMLLYIAFFQVFLSGMTSSPSVPYNAKEMCISKKTVADYETCNSRLTKYIVSAAENNGNLYDSAKSKSLIKPNICMDMMWRIVNIDPFWNFGSLTFLGSSESDRHRISKTLKASCWPTISHYLYEYKRFYIGKNKHSPLFIESIRNRSERRIQRILDLCQSTNITAADKEKSCKKIGLYLVLDILYPELLGRPSWFLTLLDPNSAKTQLAFLRNKVPNPGQNEYLKMYNNFVDRIVPKDTEIFPVVKNCNNSMDIANKSLCYIQSIRTVFDLGANVDIQHYHIHDMVTGKRLSALKTNYAICDDKSNSSSADNLCGTGYSGYINSLTLQYLEMENANLVVTNNTTKTNENILTYMRGRANYEFWQKLKSTK